MHELAAGQDTQRSWPVGITGFGLRVTDQPGTAPLAGTEALAGIPAAPARTTATSRTGSFAAIRLILPSRQRRPGAGQTANTVPARPAASGRLVQNFMVTPMLRWPFAGPLGHARRPEGGERAVPLAAGEGRGRARPSP